VPPEKMPFDISKVLLTKTLKEWGVQSKNSQILKNIPPLIFIKKNSKNPKLCVIYVQRVLPYNHGIYPAIIISKPAAPPHIRPIKFLKIWI
jgi:hypothetical protein